MKKQAIIFTLSAVFAYIALSSYSTGPTAILGNLTTSQGSTATCSGCHGGSASTTNINITLDSAGIPLSSTYYTPGITYTLNISGTNTASLPYFGFQFSSVTLGQTQAGTYSNFPLHVHQINNSGLTFVEHQAKLDATSPGVYHTSFSWTAPPVGTGTIKMYCALNAVDGVSTGGDRSGLTNITLIEGAVCPAPVITSQPQPVSVCAGNQASFSVSSSSSNISYQWYVNNNAIVGATTNSYTISTTTVGNAGNYKCVLTNNNCPASTTSNIVPLTVTAGPPITTQPLPVTTCVGSTASFTVATSASNVSYQWLLNGNPIPGATNPTYSISNVSAADAGTYIAVISNSCTNTASNPVNLTINPNPVITVQPQPQSSCGGNAVSFTVATSSPGVGYQWYFNGNPITGANTSTYSILSVNAGNIGNYSVQLQNTCGTSFSNSVPLTNGAAPTITTQPSSTVVCNGASATFTVVSPTSGVSYQWLFNGTAIPGETNSSLTVFNVSANEVGNYRVVITNNCGTVLSSIATLNLYPFPIVTTQPASVNICLGHPATFSVTTNTAAVTYQWQFNAANIPGATASSYTIPSVTAANVGNYRVKINANNCGFITYSDMVNLNTLSKPTITTQPLSVTTCSHSQAVFTVNTPLPNVAYQWLYTSVPIPGATGSSYIINNATTNNVGNYKVTLTNTCGSDTSNTAVLVIKPSPAPVITRSGDDLFTTPGYAAYQWIRNGQNIPGATSSSYHAINSANYNVRLTATNGCSDTAANPHLIADLSGVNNVTGNNDIKIYPTITNGKVSVNLPTGYEGAQINVYNTVGQEIFIPATTGLNRTIQLENIPAALYIIRITNGTDVLTYKVFYQP